MENNTKENGCVVHITGASGSGTTTLAKRLCEKFGYHHYDTDDFFWEQTDPPFTTIRAVEERQVLLESAVRSCKKCIISGSLTGWGDIFIPSFDLVIYLYAQTDVRLGRLQKREFERFGDRILPGGDMEEEHKKFLIWASQYDSGGMNMRSAEKHEKWLKGLTCPVIRLDGTAMLEDNIALLETVFFKSVNE